MLAIYRIETIVTLFQHGKWFIFNIYNEIFYRCCFRRCFTAVQGMIPNFTKNRPFRTVDTWSYCLRRHIDLSVDNVTEDYGKRFSSIFSELSESGGGSIRLLDGTYTVETPIVFQSNTCLLGQSLNGVVIRIMQHFLKKCAVCFMGRM